MYSSKNKIYFLLCSANTIGSHSIFESFFFLLVKLLVLPVLFYLINILQYTLLTHLLFTLMILILLLLLSQNWYLLHPAKLLLQITDHIFLSVILSHFQHSHKRRKDTLDGSLDRVLFAVELEFPKVLVLKLPQNTLNLNMNVTDNQNN